LRKIAAIPQHLLSNWTRESVLLYPLASFHAFFL